MKTPIEFANEILSDKEPYALKIAKELRQSVGDRVLLDQAAQCLEDDCTYLRKVAKSINEWAKGEAEESFRSPVATAEKSSVVGDAAKLREALITIRDKAHEQYVNDYGIDTVWIQDVANAALAAPPRNCEVGTPEEQMKRQHDTMCNTTKACPDSDWSCRKCFAEWAQMPYEEGGAK